MPPLTPYILTSLISAAIIAAMGICLLALPVPKEPQLRNYRISRRFLGAAYIALALQSIAGVLWHISIHTDMLVPMIQAFLFTYSLITLLNLNYATLRRVLVQCAIIASLSVLIVVNSSVLSSPRPALTYTATIGYFCLFGYYVWIFFREYRNYKRRADDFYAGDERNFLRWVSRLFIMAACVGAVGGMISKGNTAFLIFICVYTFMYVYMAIRYIGYLTLFRRIAPAVTAQESDKQSETEFVTRNIREGLKRWIESKEYLHPDVTLESLASSLYTNQTYLSRYINNHYGRNFRSWVNSMRIEEAIGFIESGSPMSMDEIAERSGFQSRTTFFRHFVAATGTTPAKYTSDGGGSDGTTGVSDS